MKSELRLKFTELPTPTYNHEKNPKTTTKKIGFNSIIMKTH